MPIDSRTLLRIDRATLLLALVGAAACGGVNDPGKPGAPVTGSWRYVARQSVPADADLTGTIAFTLQNAATVSGALDAIETDARGQQRRLAGAFSGRTLDSTTVDIDVALTTGVRRHVGVVKGDSLTGSWIETPLSGGAPNASGTFRAARQR